jgi:hypothetical protein
MRFRASVTTVSWIPSESVPGIGKMVFASGMGHYDDPPPDTLGDLEALRHADRFRFAHHLAGWIEVTDDRVVHAGYQPDSGLTMGSTLLWVLGRGRLLPRGGVSHPAPGAGDHRDLRPVRANRGRSHGRAHPSSD